jgi:RimJ/RimL family protein N-acetyltransferase
MSELSLEPHPGLSAGWWREQTWQRGDRCFRAIREEDLEDLRQWRNAQQHVLRQQRPLSVEHQRHWFADVVRPSYEVDQPSALLVTVELAGSPIGYGGLTNIDWVSRRGELSFLAATERAKDPDRYAADFSGFLDWVVTTAFDELQFHRLFTETWSFRSAHISCLERAGMRHEGTMRQHVAKDGTVYDALLHGILRTDPRTP